MTSKWRDFPVQLRRDMEILRIENATKGNCGFLKIEKKLDSVDGILHFAGIVANDYPSSEDMARLGHTRKVQLGESLGEACALLLDVIERYERLIRVHGFYMHSPEFFCRECAECPEDWELNSAKLDHRKPCPMRDEEVYTDIRERIETNIESLASLLVLAEDEKHGCGKETAYKPELPSSYKLVREVIHEWIKLGYFRDRLHKFSEE